MPLSVLCAQLWKGFGCVVEECILDFDEYDKGGASNLTAQMSGSWMTSPLGIIVFRATSHIRTRFIFGRVISVF